MVSYLESYCFFQSSLGAYLALFLRVTCVIHIDKQLGQKQLALESINPSSFKGIGIFGNAMHQHSSLILSAIAQVKICWQRWQILIFYLHCCDLYVRDFLVLIYVS
jgi:hypothetical protein